MTYAGGARFWIADLHLGHAKVAELRGFASVREHDTHILSQLARLDEWDTLWVLGDVTGGKSTQDEDEALALLRQLVPARMHLIPGNHDSASATHRGAENEQARWLETFASVQQFARVRLHRQNVLMSHYPYARSGDGPGRPGSRYNEYRLPDEGMLLVHGHTHQIEPHMVIPRTEHLSDALTLDERLDRQQYCVSWDVHRGLVTEHMLNDWIKGVVAE